MKYNLLRTDGFSIQLEDILDHVEKTYGNETTRKVLGRLKTSMKSIEDNPYIGFEIASRVLIRTRWRTIIVGKNTIFYIVDETNKTIILCVIVDQRSDYTDIIKEIK